MADSITDQLGPVKSWVSSAARQIASAFGLSTFDGYGTRPNNPTSDHPKGLALDVPVGSDTGLGDRVAAWVQANAAALGVKYVIWQQQLWRPGQGWSPMNYIAGGGDGYDPNHLRHVHLSFTATGPTGGAAVTTPVSSAGLSISNPLDALNPSTWATAGLKIAGVGAGLTLIVLGLASVVAEPAAAIVKEAL